jgi:hypothetical protein
LVVRVTVAFYDDVHLQQTVIGRGCVVHSLSHPQEGETMRLGGRKEGSCVVRGWIYSRMARVEKDWTWNRHQLRMTADFCPLYFNDCTALLGLITMEPVIQSGQFFLIHGQKTHSLELYFLLKAQNVGFFKSFLSRP